MSKSNKYIEQLFDILYRIRVFFLFSSGKDKYQSSIRSKAFIKIENERRWGKEHASGWGSTVSYTNLTREIIEDVVRNYNIQSMLDAACGDFAWMPLVLKKLPLKFKYIGCDIVPNLINANITAHPEIEFKLLDFVSDSLPICDLIFCRDALQHLPLTDIKNALLNFSNSGASFLLASTHLRRYGWKNGRENRVGQCRDRNLLLKPFSLPDPIAVYSEQDESHKFLGLWKLPF